MSFYVTLPSNSSKEFYPNNTLTDYTTKLEPSSFLNQQYEVAVMEAGFPYNWFNANSEPIIFNKINADKDSQYTRMFFNKWPLYQNVETLEKEINSFLTRASIKVAFNYLVDLRKWVIKIEPGYQIVWNGQHEFFGFSKENIDGGDSTMKKEETLFFADKERDYQFEKVKFLYIYSDIVEFQHVGDTYAPLLRVVNASSSKAYAQLNYIFTTPHYIPVSRKNIDSIQIKLTDEFGNPIKFANEGRVLIKLHFRPRTIA